MKPVAGFELSTAATALHTSAARLRKRLLQLGAIEKTGLGYVAAAEYHRRGLLLTGARQHTIATDHGYIKKHYTVVLVTGDGIAWLQQQPTHEGVRMGDLAIKSSRGKSE